MIPSMKRRCSVYLAQCDGHLKIGVAFDVRSRMIELQTGSPKRLTLYGSREFVDMGIARRVEAWLHRRFKDRRVGGEWFALDAEETWQFLSTLRPPRIKARPEVAAAWPDHPDDERIADLLTPARA